MSAAESGEDTAPLPLLRSGTAIDVAGLAMEADGPVFGPLDLRVPEGGRLVVTGSAGTGKTALLLALTGRMAISGGTGRVLGQQIDRSAEIRRRSSLAWVTGLTDLDKDLSVEQHIAERLIGLQSWYHPWVGRSRVARALEELPVETELPPTCVAGDLTERQRFALEVALARLDGTPMLGVDNLDLLREGEDRRWAWSLLGSLQERSDTPLTLIVTAQDAEVFGDDIVQVRL